MADNRRILTGHRPTGPRHLGHLVGTLRTWANLQNDFQCFFLVADLHVMTTDYGHPERIRANTIGMLADWLAAGIDPQKSTLVLQSAVPEHAQLSLLLSMLTTVSRLERVPTYKEQVQALNLLPSLGLLTYPVLQAADILLYRADRVPVGEDQLPHLELTREVAHRFNQIYGLVFPEPQPILSQTPRLPGTENRTMHTSYGNAVFLKDTPEETTQKILGMYTDPTRIHASDPGHIENNPLFTYLDVFDPDAARVSDLKLRYQSGKVGDVAIKQHLAQMVNQDLAPLREKRAELITRPDDLVELVRAGTSLARQYARDTLTDVQDRMGLNLSATWRKHEPANDNTSMVGAFC